VALLATPDNVAALGMLTCRWRSPPLAVGPSS